MNQSNLLGHASFALADASCPPPIKTDFPPSWSVTDQLQVFICCNDDKQRSITGLDFERVQVYILINNRLFQINALAVIW